MSAAGTLKYAERVERIKYKSGLLKRSRHGRVYVQVQVSEVLVFVGEGCLEEVSCC